MQCARASNGGTAITFSMPTKHAKIPEPLAEGAITTRAEKKQVEERVAIGANVVYETIRREGEDELERRSSALAWSGLAAGLSMGFSFVAEAALDAYLPNAPWRPLISRFGYCVGFLIVILGRQQLFTENTLTVILPILLRKDRKTLFNVARLWSVVLSSNLIGTALFAYCIAYIHFFDPTMQQSFHDIGVAHLGVSFGTVLMRAIFAGWLIALMVWLLPGAETSRVSVIIIITYLVGLANLNHIIAGSTTMFYLVATHSMSLAQYFARFFVPTLLGNIIGGVSMVAALGHAQVVGAKS
jgi:formate/nitrite transporter FocA (FNT family)